MSANAFHLHLDVCPQCREHPLALCVTGARLLEKVLEADFEKRDPMSGSDAYWKAEVIPSCCGLPMLLIDLRTDLKVWKCEKCGRNTSDINPLIERLTI